MSNQTRVLITGAGGFIGHHLVKRLKREGVWVRGTDLKYPRYSETDADDFIIGDDWSLAAAILVALGLTRVLVQLGLNSWWLMPLAVTIALGNSLRREVSKVEVRSKYHAIVTEGTTTQDSRD